MNDQQQQDARSMRALLFIALCATPVVGFLIADSEREWFAIVATAAFSFFAGWTVRGAK